MADDPDYEAELLKRLQGIAVRPVVDSGGANATPATAAAAPEEDYESSLIGRLRSEVVTDALTKKKKPSESYAERVAGSPGAVVDVPGYSQGESILNGLLQGYYPNVFA